MDISILIASLRPEPLKALITDIEANIGDVKYEILVTEEPGGIYKGIDKLVPKAKGEYLFHIPDDIKLGESAGEKMLKFMRDKEDDKPLQGVFNVKTEHGFVGWYGYFNKRCSGFPFIKKSWIDQIKGFMDTAYHSFYGDPDLSLRVHRSGGRVLLNGDAIIHHHQINDGVKQESMKAFYAHDEAVFQKRWGGYQWAPSEEEES